MCVYVCVGVGATAYWEPGLDNRLLPSCSSSSLGAPRVVRKSSSLAVDFQDRNYHHKLVAIQIPHDAGVERILYIGRKFLLRRGSHQGSSRNTISKPHALNHGSLRSILFHLIFWVFFYRIVSPVIETGSLWPLIGIFPFNPLGAF